MQHPYLYFSEEDLPAIRERIEKPPFDQRWARLMELADGYLDRPVARPDEILRRELWPMGVAGTCAFAYAVTGEERYADRAKAEAFAALDLPKWHHGYEWNLGLDLPSSHATVTCCLVYDWCYDALTEEEREKFRQGILEKGVRIYLESVEENDEWWRRSPGSNWCGVCNGAGGIAGLTLYDECEETKRAVEHAWDNVRWFLRQVIQEDGGGHEGVMYWRYGVRFSCLLATAAERFFGDDDGIFEEITEKLTGYWDIYMQGPDLRYANFNNMNGHTFAGLYGFEPRDVEGGPHAYLAALFESRVPGGDELLLWGADNGSEGVGWQGVSPFYFLWRREAPPAGLRPRLDDAALFRGAGHAIFHSKNLWFAYQGGKVNDHGHSNKDLGSFVLVCDGERLVHDPGYGAGDAADHSTIVVPGEQQPRGARARYLRFGSGDGFHYLASDLSDVYQSLRRWVRHAVMVRGRYLVLLDDIVTDGVKPEWRLQSRLPADADGDGATVRGANTHLHVCCASPADAELAARPVAIEMKNHEVPFHTVTLEPGEPAEECLFACVLYPVSPGSKPPEVSFRSGRLTVTRDGHEDTIEFTQEDGCWMLTAVNDADASAIPDGSERTLTLFRR
ncbi:MAG: DUF4962 domain-containing protein [Candidatus Brocadiia bacterium]